MNEQQMIKAKQKIDQLAIDVETLYRERENRQAGAVEKNKVHFLGRDDIAEARIPPDELISDTATIVMFFAYSRGVQDTADRHSDEELFESTDAFTAVMFRLLTNHLGNEIASLMSHRLSKAIF